MSPGRKPEVLARFDGRPRQHDARDGAGFQRFDGGGDGEIGLAGAGRTERRRSAVWPLSPPSRCVGCRCGVGSCGCSSGRGRWPECVIEDEVVNTGAIDGVKLGAACGAFGHIRTPVSVVGGAGTDRPKQNAPASGGVGDRSRLKVRLTGHAVGGPPVIHVPSGLTVLERIGTSFSYRRKPTPKAEGGHKIYGA